jgi:hypothetical protein
MRGVWSEKNDVTCGLSFMWVRVEKGEVMRWVGCVWGGVRGSNTGSHKLENA